ncbi:MAG: cupin domain-containing protein [Brevefilum sp.]|nr:cupin domain-containing protein [Brevefilum sp.]
MIITKITDYPARLGDAAGESIQELLGLQAGGASSHSLATITIQPGKSSAPHFHKKSEESYMILSGVATMHIDQAQFELAAGETVLIEPMEVHQISNHRDEALTFLAVCVPAWYPEDSFPAEEVKSR